MTGRLVLAAAVAALLSLTLAIPTLARPGRDIYPQVDKPAADYPKLAPGRLVERAHEVRVDGTVSNVNATKIVIKRPAEGGGKTRLVVDGEATMVSGRVNLHLDAGAASCGITGDDEVQASTGSTTVTSLPGGGTRIDTSDGSRSQTVITDPHGGKNGGTRTTVSTTDSEGNTTTTTVVTDGSDGSSTTTVSTSCWEPRPLD